MSGLVDRPSSLCEWAKVEEGEFVPRRIYGEYLEYLLSEAIAENSGKTNFTHLRVEVSNLINQDGGYKATFSDGTHQDFDAIVLAIGNSESLIPKFLNYLPVSGCSTSYYINSGHPPNLR